MKKNGQFISCKECGKQRYVAVSVIRQGRGKYCSQSCSSKNAVLGMLKVRGESWRKNVSIGITKRFQDKTKHPRWKGDNVGYSALHDWVEKVLGKPQFCESCGTEEDRVYHWANKSYNYLRNEDDWLRMCVPCHRLYDYSGKTKKLEAT